MARTPFYSKVFSGIGRQEFTSPFEGRGIGLDLHNREILVVGYGSLLSGRGLNRTPLVARDVHPVSIQNARRGLAKWSSHGRYLAMDIEPVDRATPISASIGLDGAGIGGLLLSFDRTNARKIAQREDYKADSFERLIGLADRAGQQLGEFLMAIAIETNFDLLAYRIALREMLDYTSPGYIFHPVPLDDGRFAIIAIGSGFEGSGDLRIVSRRKEFGMDRLLSLEEAMRTEIPGLDRAGQSGYYAECVLGGLHGLNVGDLAPRYDPNALLARGFAVCLRGLGIFERERFIEATSLNAERYEARFSARQTAALVALLKLPGVV
jgi:hypothetical protein